VTTAGRTRLLDRLERAKRQVEAAAQYVRRDRLRAAHAVLGDVLHRVDDVMDGIEAEVPAVVVEVRRAS
jgi:hypothetical protein